MKQYLTQNSNQTKKIGERLAKKIIRAGTKKTAVVLAMEGSFGVGKTTFLQGFAKGLGVKGKITSPTFVILKSFKITKTKSTNKKFKNFCHFDCYRIEKPEELIDLDFKEIIKNPRNIVAVEWSERIKKIIPKKIFLLKLSFLKEKKRRITINVVE